MLYIIKGDSETISVGPIETCDRRPVDLSESTVKMVIKSSVEQNDEDAVFSQEISNPDTNTVAFILSAEDTRTIEAGDYIIGVKIVWDDGTEKEIVRDNIRFTKGVFND